MMDQKLFCRVRKYYKHVPITYKNILQVVHPATVIYTFKQSEK